MVVVEVLCVVLVKRSVSLRLILQILSTFSVVSIKAGRLVKSDTFIAFCVNSAGCYAELGLLIRIK